MANKAETEPITPETMKLATDVAQAENTIQDFAVGIQDDLKDSQLTGAEIVELIFKAPAAVQAGSLIVKSMRPINKLSPGQRAAFDDAYANLAGVDVATAPNRLDATFAYANLTFLNASKQVKATRALIAAFKRTTKKG